MYIEHLRREPPPQTERLLFGKVDDLAEKIGALDEAIRSRDTATLSRALANYNLLEGLVITKGTEGKNLTLLQDALHVMEENMGEGFAQLPRADQMEKLIREGGVDPMALAEYCATLYHFHNDAGVMQDAGALLSVSDEFMPPLTKGVALNVLGSMMRRNNDPHGAREKNRTALALITAEPSAQTDPNLQWLIIKLKHGMIVHRAADDKTYQDMPEKLLGLAREREALGDVMHIGRTELDVAELYQNLGDVEAAAYYAQRALDQQRAVGYGNGAAQAAQLLGKLYGNVGDRTTARRFYQVGIGIGEHMKRILQEEVDEMKQEMEKEMKYPATCLIELGQGNYLVQKIQNDPEQYMCVTVDQELKKPDKSGRSSEQVVRQQLGGILNILLAEATGLDTAIQNPITLSQRQRNLHFKGKTAGEDGSLRFRYKVEIPENPSTTGIVEHLKKVDKTTISGYSILSFADLVRLKDSFDSQSQELIKAEEERLAS